MDIINKLLRRSDNDESETIFNHYNLNVLEDEGTIRFEPDGSSGDMKLVIDDDKYNLDTDIEFERDYLESQDAYIEDKRGRVVKYFGESESDGSLTIRMREEQLSSLKGVVIDDEDYCEKGNLVVSREGEDIILEITGFPKFTTSTVLKFGKLYPNIKILESNLEELNELDLTVMKPGQVDVMITSRIDGEIIFRYSDIVAKSSSINNFNDEIFYAQFHNRIEIEEASEIEEKFNEYSEYDYEVSIKPNDHIPVSKEFSLIDDEEIVFKSKDFKELGTLILKCPTYFNPSSRYPKLSYDSYDIIELDKKYNEKEKEDNKIIFNSVLPNEEIKILYGEQVRTSSSPTRIEPLEPGETREVKLDITLRKKTLKVILDTDKQLLVSINGEGRTINNDESFEFKVEDKNSIEIKDTKGNVLLSDEYDDNEMTKIKEIRVGEEVEVVNLD